MAKRWIAAIALAAVASTAIAQDAEEPKVGIVLDARAVDFTATMTSHDADGHTAVPLANRQLSIQIGAPKAADQLREVTTDDDGRIQVELGNLAPGAWVSFAVFDGDPATTPPSYYARPWIVDDEAPPRELRFYEVSLEGERVRWDMVNQVITTVQRDDAGTTVAQIRHIAFLTNDGGKVYLGPVDVPIPTGFELGTVSVNDVPRDPVVGPGVHGGTVFRYGMPVFPSPPGTGPTLQFHLTMTAPYADGELLDAGWHAELPVMRYHVAIEQGLFEYMPPTDGSTALQDGGAQAAMGNVKRPTHMWITEHIRPHANVGVMLSMGAAFPWRPVLTVAMIVLLVLAAIFLGLAFGRRAPAPDDPRVIAHDPGSVASQVALLDRKLATGEITTVEHAVRSRALAGTAAPAKSTAGAAASSDLSDATAALDAIVARADDATVEQLRDDVRTLARLVKRLHGAR